MKQSEQIPYLVAIHRGLNLTHPRFLKLKSFFEGDFKKAFNASLKDWQAADIDNRGITKFFSQQKQIIPEKEHEQLIRCGAQVLIKGERGFPITLENLDTPPVLLFVRGKIEETDFPSISVVGSRKISTYGQRALTKIVSTLASHHITIISGLAYGADSLAHEVAMKNGSRTIAVLGNGIETIYPPKNKALAEKIITEKKGAIISEYLPGTELRPEYFPVRNRIVAGLSKGTLIIEAAKKSGTLITANLANEMGREVFAVPGEIFAKSSEGTNHIIANGQAHLAVSGEQIMEILNFTHHRITQENKKTLPLSDNDRLILKVFEGQQKIHIDDIYQACELENSVISSHLVLMEMKGIVLNLGNQTYDLAI